MNTLAFSMPGGWEWLAIAVVGLLIFGKRLPEVGRSLGKGIVEFKRGLKGIEEEADRASDRPASGGAAPTPQQLREPQRWEGQAAQPAAGEQTPR